MNPDSVENYILLLKNKSISHFILNVEDKQFPKIYDFNEETLKIINETKNKIFLRELPFNQIILLRTVGYDLQPIDFELTTKVGYDFKKIKRVYIRGILVQRMVDGDDTLVDLMINYIIQIKADSEKLNDAIINARTSLMNYNSNENGWLHNQMRLVICNFLDFLNHPKTEIANIEYSKEENSKRIKRGKLPHPSNVCIVKLDNVIKQYSDKSNNVHREFSYKFWVRGHYIHFRNKERFRHLYSLSSEELSYKGYQTNNDLISRFIPAFIKGKGKLYNKRYEVNL